jgi:hypothetical protein
LTNLHQNGRAVRLHFWDGRLWSAGEDLSYGQSKTVGLAAGTWSTIVAVDRGLVGCVDGENDDGLPGNVSCQRWKSNPLLGDSAGTTVDGWVY